MNNKKKKTPIPPRQGGISRIDGERLRRLAQMRAVFEEVVTEVASDINRNYKNSDLFTMLVLGFLWGQCDVKSIQAALKRRERLVKSILGIPSVPAASTFTERLNEVDADELERFFHDYANKLLDIIDGIRGYTTEESKRLREGDGHTVDGKALIAGTDRKNGGKTPYVVNMFSVVYGIWMALRHVVGKSNEKPAGTELIAASGEGGVCLGDAAFGSKKGVEAAMEAAKNYILAVKGCSGRIHTETEKFLVRAAQAYVRKHPLNDLPLGTGPEMEFEGGTLSVLKERDDSHGRVMVRYYFLFSSVGFLEKRGVNLEEYPGLATVGLVLRSRDLKRLKKESQKKKKKKKGKKKKKKEKRMHVCYICSYNPGIEGFAQLVRSEWLIENSGHWILDELYREDRSTVRNEGMQLVMAVARRIAYNIVVLIRECKSFGSHSQAKRWLADHWVLGGQMVGGFVEDPRKAEVMEAFVRVTLGTCIEDLWIDPGRAEMVLEEVAEALWAAMEDERETAF